MYVWMSTVSVNNVTVSKPLSGADGMFLKRIDADRTCNGIYHLVRNPDLIQ